MTELLRVQKYLPLSHIHIAIRDLCTQLGDSPITWIEGLSMQCQVRVCDEDDDDDNNEADCNE